MGAGLVPIALLLIDTPSLLVVLWLLLVLRIVNRTVGLPAKPLDSPAVLGLGACLTWQGYWMVGLMTAVAFLLDGLLSPPLRTHLFRAVGGKLRRCDLEEGTTGKVSQLPPVDLRCGHV